jgi:hypothetical protein
METQYTWKTKMFSRKFEIYRYENHIGELKKREWSGKYAGEMNGKKFVFKIKGFFKKETSIINASDDSVIGTIDFTFWKTKSTVTYQNKEYKWQFDNFVRNKWSLSNENGFLVRYHSQAFKGTIDSYTEDEVLILTGFFIRNYLKQRSAEAAAASS